MREHGLPARLEEVRLVGGGSQSALWRQIVADTFDVRVACPAEPESAALGAALQAAAVDAGAGAALGEWSTTAQPPSVLRDERCAGGRGGGNSSGQQLPITRYASRL